MSNKSVKLQINKSGINILPSGQVLAVAVQYLRDESKVYPDLQTFLCPVPAWQSQYRLHPSHDWKESVLDGLSSHFTMHLAG